MRGGQIHWPCCAVLAVAAALILPAAVQAETDTADARKVDRSLIQLSAVHTWGSSPPAAAPANAQEALPQVNAVTAIITISGPNVWPFTRSKASDFIQALSDAMRPHVPIFAGCPDVIITSAIQATVMPDTTRRLLAASTAAAVGVIVNGHSSEIASTVASNLTTAISGGTFKTKLNTLAAGYSIDSSYITSGPTVQATSESFGCTYGTVAGMCAGGKPAAPQAMTPTGPQAFWHDRQKAEAGDAQLKANASNAKSLNLTAGTGGSMIPGLGSQRMNSKLGSMRLSNANEQKAPVKFAQTRGSGFIEVPEERGPEEKV
ncbi:hypothetical protein WJX74_009859 [Apatococcus lobatus]|uniref:Uncharacterized protein n=1 Tax=Apatococcus lobatus TaxID=904363 RepID=A0AAW1RQB7_9CHLO